MPDNRKNLQVAQPGIEGYESADKNGWPTPLVSPSDPLKMTVTNSKSGSQKNFDPTSTSGQGALSLAEGHVGPSTTASQGGHSDKLETSQQQGEEHSTPESERSQ